MSVMGVIELPTCVVGQLTVHNDIIMCVSIVCLMTYKACIVGVAMDTLIFCAGQYLSVYKIHTEH